MGQTSSREPTGEDLLFHVLDNEAVIGHLLSSGTYRHFHSDVSKLREGATSKGSVADAHDYFHDLSDADQVTSCTPPSSSNPTHTREKRENAYADHHGHGFHDAELRGGDEEVVAQLCRRQAQRLLGSREVPTTTHFPQTN